MERLGDHGKKISEILFEMIITVLIYGGFIWMAVNLFFVAFHIRAYISYLQAISIDFLILVIYGIVGAKR